MSAVLKIPEATFSVVPKGEIEALWPLVEGGIARALETSDQEATPEDTKAGLLAGRTQLALLISEGSLLGIVFMFLAFPRFKIARILLGFGRGSADVQEAMARGEAWAKEMGCRYVECWVASRARVRLFKRYGYDQKYYVLRKRL